MMWLGRWVMVVFAVVGLGRVGFAFISGGPPADQTISAAVWGSDCVVRGTVVSVQELPEVYHELVTLRVHETYRGLWMETIDVDDWSVSTLHGLVGEHLFFLSRGDVVWGKQTYRMSSPPIGVGSAWGDEVAGLVISDDLRLVKKAGEVLDAVRNASALRGKARLAYFRLSESMAIRLRKEAGNGILVSLTPPTFAIAREWATSGDANLRWGAATILSEDLSRENLAALRQLVDVAPTRDDPRHDYAGFARARALTALRNSGVAGLPPIVRARPIFDLKGAAAWGSLLGICLAPAVHVVRMGARKARWGEVAWLAAFLIVVVLHIRSYGAMDAVSCGGVDVALEGGEVYVARHSRPDVDLSGNFSLCAPGDLLGHVGSTASNLKSPLGLFMDLPGSWELGQTLEPRWSDYLRVFFPVWVVEVLMVLPWVVVIGWRRVRMWRVRRRRGFPVV